MDLFELENKIIELLNESGQPLDAKFYVLETVQARIEIAFREMKHQTSEQTASKD